MVKEWGGFDLPDDRDHLYGALAWAEKIVELPKVVDLSPWLVLQSQDGKNDPSTGMSCGNHWIVNGTNCNNLFDNGGKYIDALARWVRWLKIYTPIYKKEGVDPITEWTAKQHHMDFSKKEEDIIAYFRLYTVQEFKENLARKRVLYTGSWGIVWRKTRERDDKIAVMWPWDKHIFFICWYDDNKKLLKCGNSTRIKDYDNWYFYLKYEDIGCLFTVHSLLDYNDQDVLDEALEIRANILKEIKEYKKQGKPLKVRHTIALRNRWMKLEDI